MGKINAAAAHRRHRRHHLPNFVHEQALRLALSSAENSGARVRLFGGAALASLPHYFTGGTPPDISRELGAAVLEADGLIIASPGYRGSVFPPG